MASETDASLESQIGETAGLIWHKLNVDGPISASKLVSSIDAPRDVVMQAIGWLAREGKLNIEQTKRGRSYSLR